MKTYICTSIADCYFGEGKTPQDAFNELQNACETTLDSTDFYEATKIQVELSVKPTIIKSSTKK